VKSLIRPVIAFIALSLPLTSFASFISGDVTGGGSVSGSVTSSNAWVQSNPVDGAEVNFWTLTAQAGDLLSIAVTSQQIEFGFSIYQGLVQQLDLLVPGFANDASFGSNIFVAGTPSFGAAGTSLLNIALPFSGLYTIAVGGEGFSFEPSFDYDMDVSVTSVPLPGTFWLMGPALIGLAVARRRRAAMPAAEALPA